MMTYKEYLAEHVKLDARVNHCEIQLRRAEDERSAVERKYRDASEREREILKPDLDTMREAVVDCGFQLADAEAKRKGFENAHPEFNPPRDEDATPEKKTWSERVQEWKQVATGLQTLVAGAAIATSLNVSATLTDVSLPSPDGRSTTSRSISLDEIEKQADDWRSTPSNSPDGTRVTSAQLPSPENADRLDKFNERVQDDMEHLDDIRTLVEQPEPKPGGSPQEPNAPDGSPPGGGPSGGRGPTSPGELPDPDPPASTLTKPPEDKKESGPSLDDDRRR